jgi:hypothetical protein
MERRKNDFTLYNSVVQFLGIEHGDMAWYILLDEGIFHLPDMAIESFYGRREDENFIWFHTTIGK